MRIRNVLALGIGCILPMAAFGATAINLAPAPDIQAQYFSADYVAGTSTLTANGLATSLTQYFLGNPTFFNIEDGSGGSGSFFFTANISTAGVLTGGSFSISGCIDDQGGGTSCSAAPTVLLAGTLTSLTYLPSADSELDFGFSNITGTLAGLYSDVHYLDYIKMNLSGFPGAFGSDFSTDFSSNQADIGIVVLTPEPTSTFLLFSGAVAFLLVRRKSFRRP